MRFTVAAFINSGEGRFFNYEEGTDKLTHGVTIDVEAPSVEDALNQAFVIGNREGVDASNNQWPTYVRSLSVGDVLLVDFGWPDGKSVFFTVDPIGFSPVSAYQVMLSVLYGTEKGEVR